MLVRNSNAKTYFLGAYRTEEEIDILEQNIDQILWSWLKSVPKDKDDKFIGPSAQLAEVTVSLLINISGEDNYNGN